MAKVENFDFPAPDDFLKKNTELVGTNNLILMERFSKEQTKDFYLGMIAAERVILSFMKSTSGEHLKSGIIELGLCATVIANEKLNTEK